MTYVGLTDDPVRKRQQHGNPPDWKQIGPFETEQAAIEWQDQYIGKPGYLRGPRGEGWRYGYWYTITLKTRQ